MGPAKQKMVCFDLFWILNINLDANLLYVLILGSVWFLENNRKLSSCCLFSGRVLAILEIW